MQVDGMDKLEQKAAFKFPEISEGQKAIYDEQVVTNNLLCRLCDLKEEQQDSDNKFRSEWKNAKVFDTRLSLWVLILANAALYLDVIKINSDGTIITAILSLFN